MITGIMKCVTMILQELKAENDELKRKLTEYEQTQALIISEIEKLKSLKSETKEIKLGEK